MACGSLGPVGFEVAGYDAAEVLADSYIPPTLHLKPYSDSILRTHGSTWQIPCTSRLASCLFLVSSRMLIAISSRALLSGVFLGFAVWMLLM